MFRKFDMKNLSHHSHELEYRSDVVNLLVTFLTFLGAPFCFLVR